MNHLINPIGKPVIGVLLLAALAICSCKTPQVQLDPALRAKPMKAKGTQGLMIGQVVKFGDFHTDKVKRGWLKQYDIPFFIRFKGASEKLSFTQYGPESSQALVSCISKLRSQELEILRDFFSIPLKYKNYFAGNILPASAGTPWDFVLYNPNGDFLRESSTAGLAQNQGRSIEITPIRSLLKQPKWVSKFAVYGYHFYWEGQPIGAVSTINNGTVWLDRDLDPEIRIVVASLATALLLRTDVENDADGF